MNVASILRQEWRKAEPNSRQGDQVLSEAPSTRQAQATPLELSERPEMRETLERYERVARVVASAGIAEALPSGLVPAPGRAAHSDKLDAAGYVDLHSRSVGVDIACWHAPPGQRVDESGWRMVFSWITGSDRDLRRVSLLDHPFREGRGFVASYGYEAESVPGVGVLRVSALTAGGWRIIDCWGDASESERVHHLAGQLSEM
jgi:hypothetical protein